MSPGRAAGRPRPEETSARQAAVLQCARDAFLAKGYRATTMDDIAARAGVSKRTLYLWHKDKAALFQSCVMDAAGTIILPPLDPADNLADSLARYAAALLPGLSDGYAVQMGGLLFREARDFPELRAVMLQGMQFMSQPVIALLDARGVPPAKAGELGRLFLAMLLSDVQLAIVAGGNGTLPTGKADHAQTAIRLFLHGLDGFLPSESETQPAE